MLAQSPAASPPVRTLEPKDDAANDAGFVRFRRDVRRAAEVCSEAALRRILAPSSRGNHVSSPPSRAFWRYWRVEDSSGLPGLCQVLDRAMVLGAVRWDAGLYCAPYVSCEGGVPSGFPIGVYLIGVVDGVDIRSQPSAMAPVLARPRYPVLVNCRGPYEPCGPSLADPPEGWWLARFEATVGYVTDAQVRDQIDPQLTIRRLPVGWRITYLQFYD